MDDQQSGGTPKPETDHSNESWIVRGIRNIERKLQERNSKRGETPQDRASRWTAYATVAIASFTLAAVGVSITQAFIANWQLDAMQRQLNVMEQETKRPWIGFDSGSFIIAEKLSISKDGARLTLKINKVLNGGDSAARGVNVSFVQLNVSPLPATAEDIVASYREKGPCTPETIEKTYGQGELVLPGHETSLGAIPLFVKTSDFRGDTKTQWITGCVGYRGTSKQPHATTFTYSVVNGNTLMPVPGISSGAY